jgi:hypothetical protein
MASRCVAGLWRDGQGGVLGGQRLPRTRDHGPSRELH